MPGMRATILLEGHTPPNPHPNRARAKVLPADSSRSPGDMSPAPALLPVAPAPTCAAVDCHTARHTNQLAMMALTKVCRAGRDVVWVCAVWEWGGWSRSVNWCASTKLCTNTTVYVKKNRMG